MQFCVSKASISLWSPLAALEPNTFRAFTQAGADGVAVISTIMQSANITATVKPILNTHKKWDLPPHKYSFADVYL